MNINGGTRCFKSTRLEVVVECDNARLRRSDGHYENEQDDGGAAKDSHRRAPSKVSAGDNCHSTSNSFPRCLQRHFVVTDVMGRTQLLYTRVAFVIEPLFRLRYNVCLLP